MTTLLQLKHIMFEQMTHRNQKKKNFRDVVTTRFYMFHLQWQFCLQERLLSFSNHTRQKITIYFRWPNQPDKILQTKYNGPNTAFIPQLYLTAQGADLPTLFFLL